jgi:CRP-like cAMP-binding protein
MKPINERPNLPEQTSGLQALRAHMPNAPVMAFLEKFDTFFEKKKRSLLKDEVLFSPGENPYLYIVASGALGVFRINPSGDAKEVGRVYTGAFIGEGVLSGRIQKDVQVASIVERTDVVALTKEDIDYLESLDAAVLARLYKHINNITSLRLAESGKELAIIYESTQKFQEFRELGQRGLLAAINSLKDSLSLDSMLLIEEHPYISGLLVYKYNTRFPSVWPINQKVEGHSEIPLGEISASLF